MTYRDLQKFGTLLISALFALSLFFVSGANASTFDMKASASIVSDNSCCDHCATPDCSTTCGISMNQCSVGQFVLIQHHMEAPVGKGKYPIPPYDAQNSLVYIGVPTPPPR